MRIVLACILLWCTVSLPSFSQWVQQASPSTGFLWKVRFVDAAHGWIIGSTKLYSTTDGGQSWNLKDTVLNLGALLPLTSDVVIHCEGWLGSGPNRGIRKSTNGGATWRSVDTARFVYFDVEFPTPQVGYAAGRDASTQQFVPAIRKTTDGGETWETIFTLSAGVDFEAVSFVDADRGWAMTYVPGLVYHTTNSGASWAFQDTAGLYNGTNFSMRDMMFASADSGWAVGGIAGTSVVSRTTDGGQTWSHSSGIPNTIQEIAMVNSQVGWIVGRVWNAPPQRTTDGGVTWHVQATSPSLPPGAEIYSISMLNENIGWFISNPQGRVYKTTNGGVTSVPIGEVSPSEIALDQNYPNPFNPGTTIRFGIPRAGAVSLRIFDITGRGIAILVDGELSAGEHRVEWTPANVSSGVYYYRLRAAGKVETKKLVLMK